MARTTEHDLPVAGTPGPPALPRVLGEALSLRELPRLLLAAPGLARAPRGDGGPVVLTPGYRAPEASMAPLRWFLDRLGHRAVHWGQGTNDGDVARVLPAVLAGVEELAERAGRPVALVGWSLGGVVSREVARERPDLVDRVVTYGTPVVGGPRHTVFARRYDDALLDRLEARAARREHEQPIQVPLTAIWTRRDGIVGWRSCVDEVTPGARNVEVASTHLGLGIDPDVWREVAAALAR